MNNEENRRVFRKNLRFQMLLHGKSRIQICEDLGINYTTFANWYNGDKYPRIDKIELLAQYFGISKSELIEDHDGDLVCGMDLSAADSNLAEAQKLMLELQKKSPSPEEDEQSQYVIDINRELKDCTEDEERLFLEVLRATKRSMRGNVDKKAP